MIVGDAIASQLVVLAGASRAVFRMTSSIETCPYQSQSLIDVAQSMVDLSCLVAKIA